LITALTREYDALGEKEQKRRVAGVGPASALLHSKRGTTNSVETPQQDPRQMKRSELTGGKDLEEQLREFKGRCVKIYGQHLILPKPQADSEKEPGE
jgi:hypothetical protein